MVKVDYTLFFLAFLFAILFIALIGEVVRVSESSDLKATVSTPTLNTLLLANGSQTTLSQTPSTSVTAKIYNLTWLNFDGINDNVNLSTPANLDVYQGQFTLSFWIYPINITNNVLPRVMEKRSAFVAIMGDSTNGQFGRIAIELTNITGVNTAEFWAQTNLTMNAWEHWAFVYNGSNGTWYRSGTEVSTRLINISGIWTGDEQNSSGFEYFIARRRSDLTRGLNGSLDEMRIYNTNLSLAELVRINNTARIQNKTPLGSSRDNNQVLYLPFNENQGATTYDLSNFATNGTIVEAIYQNDGNNITLSSTNDYTQSGINFTVININRAWNQIRADYSYGLASTFGFHISILRLLSGMLALIIVIFIVYVIFKLYSDNIGRTK